jgi:hypothetical protein
MQTWRADVEPYLDRVIRAEEALIEVSEGPAIVVLASCDQLAAAARQLQWWIQAHRCPDREFAVYLSELLSASVGLCAIMQLVARESPDGTWLGNHDLLERVATNLLDRIEQANRARAYLQEWRG